MKIGDNIDGYEIVSNIPGGGMADVFIVNKNDQSFALKTLKCDASEEEIKRFKREVRILQSITDNNVIEVIDCNTNTTIPYYVMPLCDGSLHSLSRTISEEDKIEYSIQFCKGIYAIHQKGITHRDIKPHNALLLSSTVKISDLGLGRFEVRDSTTLTTSPFGTDGYYPPEYLSDINSFKNGSIVGDVFMIGKSLYYIFSNGLDPRNIESELVNPYIADIISNCTKTAPHQRYTNVGEIISKLEQYKVAYIFQQKAPMSFQEIKSKYGNNKNKNYCDDMFKHLCFIGTDNITMANTLSQLTTDDLKLIFNHNIKSVDMFVKYFDDSIRNCNRWIQCEDVESFTILARVLIPLCSNTYSKQLLLALSIDYAVNFNRWNAMTTVGYIFSELSDSDMKQLTPFILEHKDSIKCMTDNFKCPMPFYLNSLLK